MGDAGDTGGGDDTCHLPINNDNIENCCQSFTSEDSESKAIWQEQRNRISTNWCLIDHPEIWKKMEDISRFEDNERLMSLVRQPKNDILQLPDASAVASHYSCSVCEEIPFPWKGAAKHDGFEDENEQCDEDDNIHLCNDGHPVCNDCFQYGYSCAKLPTDDLLGRSGNDSSSDSDSESDPSLKEKGFRMFSGSLGSWGQTQCCLSPFTGTSDAFLTEMIQSSEFACQYFYNFCDFRGRCKELQEHETNCLKKMISYYPPTQSSAKHAEQLDIVQGNIEDGGIDVDDSKILKLRKDVLIYQTAELRRKYFY